MTKLDAVNKILRALGEPKVSALDTGGTSIEAEAEDFLDDANEEVQRRGWMTNTTRNYEMELPDTLIAVSGGAGSFLYDELVTETTSGATGVFKRIDSNNVMHIVSKSGTFTGGQTLTGGVTGATRTGAGLDTVTENTYVVNPAWLKVAPAEKETRTIVVRGDYLYDETNRLAEFDDIIYLDVVRNLFFTDLPEALAEYVTRFAALEFCEFKKGEATREAVAREQRARLRALQEDGDLRRTNMLKSSHSRDVKGRRYTYPTG